MKLRSWRVRAHQKEMEPPENSKGQQPEKVASSLLVLKLLATCQSQKSNTKIPLSTILLRHPPYDPSTMLRSPAEQPSTFIMHYPVKEPVGLVFRPRDERVQDSPPRAAPALVWRSDSSIRRCRQDFSPCLIPHRVFP